MKIAAAVSLLALLVVVSSRAQERVALEDPRSLPALFPLFVSCDLVSQFITPGINEGALIQLESPVSREGARMLEESRRQYVVAWIPLLLEQPVGENRIESAPVARFDALSKNDARVRLIADTHYDFYASATAALPARTGPSTWVRIRALYGGR